MPYLEGYARASEDAEMGSDAEWENANGVTAHLALGNEIVVRVVCLRRSL